MGDGILISTFREMSETMNQSETARLDAAAMFKALGDPTRLRIFEFLRSCCCPVAVEETGDVHPVIGPTVGEVCCHVTGAEQINSKISHHLKELRLAGLITVERRGKNMICGVNRDAIAALAAYLREGANGDGSACC
jgi:ArsR family transcriptional regulator